MMLADQGRHVDPGVARFGNFPNYYQFNCVENRIKIIPANLINHLSCEGAVLALDIGSNCGDMTVGLYRHFCQNEKGGKILNLRILAVEKDANLVESCKVNNPFPEAITYHVLDFMDNERRNEVLDGFLLKYDSPQLDITFCLSVTMWIHLHHGDEGLWKFLSIICEKSKFLLIEPQPWKCYNSAARRLRKFKQEPFPFYEHLAVRHDVDKKIEQFLETSCRMVQVEVLGSTAWSRNLILYKRSR